MDLLRKLQNVKEDNSGVTVIDGSATRGSGTDFFPTLNLYLTYGLFTVKAKIAKAHMQQLPVSLPLSFYQIVREIQGHPMVRFGDYLFGRSKIA